MSEMAQGDVWSVRLFFCLNDDIGGIELYSVDGTLYENLEGREFVFQSEHTNRPTELFLQVDENGEIYYDYERRRQRVAGICRMEVLSRTVTIDNDQRESQLVPRPSASLGNGFNQMEQMARDDVWSVRLFLGFEGFFEFFCVDGTLYKNLEGREFVFHSEHTNRPNPREWFLHLDDNGDIYYVEERIEEYLDEDEGIYFLDNGRRERVATATRMEVLSRTVTVDNASTRREQSPRRTTAEAVRAVFGDSSSDEDDFLRELDRELEEVSSSSDDDVPPRLSPPDPVALADGSGAGGSAESSGTSSTSSGTKRKRRSDEKEKRQMPKKLREAIKTGNIDAIRKMMQEENLDINEEFLEADELEEGQFILQEAIFSAKIELIEFLLKNGANIEIEFKFRDEKTTPLKFTTRYYKNTKYEQITDLLLKYGAIVREVLAEQQRRERSSAERPSPLLLKLLENHTVEQSTCAICLDPLGGYAPFIMKLSCGHMFHRKCIRSAALSSRYDYSRYFECPLCKKSLEKLEIQRDGDIFIAAKTDAEGNIVYKLRHQLLKF